MTDPRSTDPPARSKSQQPVQTPVRELMPWVEPQVTELPPLTELTLQSGIPGGGNTGGGGSTVF